MKLLMWVAIAILALPVAIILYIGIMGFIMLVAWFAEEMGWGQKPLPPTNFDHLKGPCECDNPDCPGKTDPYWGM